MFLPVDDQLAILLRGAAHVEKLDELRKKLERSRDTDKPLRIKYGIDPTGFDVHLGHTVPLRKLRQFQELGHTAVLIIGTATARVGDPSGRDDSRKGLTLEQIDKNAATYLEQIAKVVDIDKAEVRPNGKWFDQFGFADMLRLLGQMTVQRMLERDDFTKRIQAKTPIYLHECLYPLMQGQDSVEIHADVELGGTEQLFNLMVGRDLQRSVGQEPQVCITMPILRGTDGSKKMGKTAGNYIGLNENATDQFGKTMRIGDELMREWLTLLTDRSSGEIDGILAGKPNEAKKLLGAEIIRFYHGAAAADEVLADWRRQFEEKGDPEHMQEVAVPTADLVEGAMPAVKLIVLAKLAASNGEARRKIEEGAFNYGPERTKPADAKATVPVSAGLVLRLGRKNARVKLTD
ncbi:MAG TPA: tyrosine--tRNA ligase [Urbifossiella sp.]|nr:tyrosine--tRNA ligase [Urbifossiella sp.]